MDRVQSAEVYITPVEDIDGTGLDEQLIQDLDIVNFARGDNDHAGDAAAKIQKRMQLHRRLAFAKLCPRKQGQTQVDGGGVQRIDAVIQIDTEGIVGVELSGSGNQNLCEVPIDAPVADTIGMCQGVARYFAPNAQVVKPRLSRPQAGLNIAQTLSIGKLGKGHA